MGDVVPFRDSSKRRWTRPEDYGHDPEPPGKPPRKPPGRKRRWLRPWMFWLLASLGVGLWVSKDPALMEPPAILASDAEPIKGKFTICGTSGSANCVLDGDSVKIGKRSIRIVGIDAPELHDAKCPQERAAGLKARNALRVMLNERPVFMVGRLDGPVDQYGRELRTIRQVAKDGNAVSIADRLIESGLVREYRGGMRGGWCPGQAAVLPGSTSRPAHAANRSAKGLSTSRSALS